MFCFTSRRRHTRCALVTGVQTCALPIVGSTEPQQGTIEPADLAWRDFFTDERLRRLIALALENNRDLRVALANVAQARAQFHVQRADLAPGLSANAGDRKSTRLNSSH